MLGCLHVGADVIEARRLQARCPQHTVSLERRSSQQWYNSRRVGGSTGHGPVISADQLTMSTKLTDSTVMVVRASQTRYRV